MKSAPISLIDYFATDLSLATNRSFKAERPVEFVDSEFQVDVALQPIASTEERGKCWQVSLDVKHLPGPETNFAYSYRIALVGKFSVAPYVKADEEERTIRIHGASVLYGMAREIARALTGRGPYRPVILPTVSFYEQKEAILEASTETIASAAAPAAKAKRRKTKAKGE